LKILFPTEQIKKLNAKQLKKWLGAMKKNTRSNRGERQKLKCYFLPAVFLDYEALLLFFARWSRKAWIMLHNVILTAF